MKRAWHPEELVEYWTIVSGEWPLIEHKHGATRLGFAVLFKFFQYAGYFPRTPQDVPLTVVDHLAPQVGVPADAWAQYAWESHRAQIRQHWGFREATVADGETLVTWLCAQILPATRRPDHLKEAVMQRCRDLRIEPPTPERLDRLMRSAVHREDTRVGTGILHRLSTTTQGHLDALLGPAEAPPSDPDTSSAPTLERALLQELRADPGRATLDNLFQEIAKLERIRALQLPPDLFDDMTPTVLHAYRQRVAVEEPYELRRHAVPLRMTLLAAFCLLRGRELTDILVDVLLELVHRLGAKAERKVEKELIEDLKRVHGKTGMLYRLAEASLDHPAGVVQEVIFPVVSEATLREVVKEWKATGPFYRTHVQTVMRSSYRAHYRRMLPPLLATLEFRSNNAMHQPLIRALALLQQYLQSRMRTYPVEEDIPLDGVVRDHWRDAVVETALPMRCVCCKLFETSSAAKKSGSLGRTAIGTLMTMFPGTLRPNGRPIMRRSSSPHRLRTLSSRFSKRCTTNSPRWIAPCRAIPTSRFSRRPRGGSSSLLSLPSQNPPICWPSRRRSARDGR